IEGAFSSEPKTQLLAISPMNCSFITREAPPIANMRPQDLVDEEDFAGNSGYLIYMSGPDKLWPASIEVQGMNLEVGRIFAIGGASRVMNEQFIDVRRRVRRPVGEWNELVIHSTGGALEATLNGEVVGRSQPGDMTEGPIGFQCEGARIQWRDIKISTKASL
ncbi:MAG: DUF1080 domain-containing protein, partial [Myxococcota bacterium]